MFLLHRSLVSGFSLPFPLKAPLVRCFFPKVGGTRLLFIPVVFHFPLLQGFVTGKRFSLFLMSISVQSNDEVVRQVKWYLIICLEILTHLKVSLSEKSLWMAMRVPNSQTCCRVAVSHRHRFPADLVAPSSPLLASMATPRPGSCCSDTRASRWWRKGP